MDKAILRFFAVFLLVGGAAACGSSGSGASLAEGESYLSITVSGDTLPNPVHFEGKTSVLNHSIFSQLSILGGQIGMASTPPGLELDRITFAARTTEAATLDETGFDMDMVIIGFPVDDGTQTYSLRERDGASTLTLTQLSDERLVMDFSFDASPTQIGGVDKVFHVEGTLEMRD